MSAPIKSISYLSGKVRGKALKEIEAILDDKKCKKYNKEFRQQLVLRLAGSVLPRIQEISGPDGKEIPLPLLGGLSNGHRNKGNKNIIDPKE